MEDYCYKCMTECLKRVEILEDIYYCEYLCGCELEVCEEEVL